MKTNFFHTSLFYNIYLYILKDVMRGSIAPEPGDFCIFICLNAALLGPPKPNSHYLLSIFFLHFSNFPGGGDDPLLQKSRGGRVPPPGSPPLVAATVVRPKALFEIYQHLPGAPVNFLIQIFSKAEVF